MAQVAVQEEKTPSSSSPLPNPNVAANANTGGDLFSPTSAAAWALSTLHNFGAAAPNDNGGPRPTADSLTGTRLFNNSGAPSNDSTSPPTTTSAPIQTDSAVIGLPASNIQATNGVTWGQTQFQLPNHVSMVQAPPRIENIDTISIFSRILLPLSSMIIN